MKLRLLAATTLAAGITLSGISAPIANAAPWTSDPQMVRDMKIHQRTLDKLRDQATCKVLKSKLGKTTKDNGATRAQVREALDNKYYGKRYYGSAMTPKAYYDEAIRRYEVFLDDLLAKSTECGLADKPSIPEQLSSAFKGSSAGSSLSS